MNGFRWWRIRDNEYDFLPAYLDIVHKPPAPRARVTAFLLILFLGAVLLWSIIGTMDVHASAHGRLMIPSHSKIIQPLERAEVSVINVKDGQEVKQGEILIELQTVDVQAEIERISHRIRFLILESVRLKALLSDTPLTSFSAPDNIPSALIERTRARLTSEVAEINTSLKQLDAKIRVNIAQQQANSKEIEAVEALKANIDQRVRARQALVESQSISRIELLEQKKEQLEAQRTLASLNAKGRVLKAEHNEIKDRITNFLAQIRREYHQELSQIEIEQDQLQQALIKAKEQLRRQILRAPVDGVVQQLSVHTLGGVVNPAQALMVIVPKQAHLEAEVNVLNKDIGFVMPGQSAQIKVDSFPFTRYGTIAGELLYISQDAVQDEALGLVFPARIRLKYSDIVVGDKRVQLGAGMSVIAEIKTSQRHIIDYLLSPLQRYQSEALRER